MYRGEDRTEGAEEWVEQQSGKPGRNRRNAGEMGELLLGQTRVGEPGGPYIGEDTKLK